MLFGQVMPLSRPKTNDNRVKRVHIGPELLQNDQPSDQASLESMKSKQRFPSQPDEQSLIFTSRLKSVNDTITPLKDISYVHHHTAVIPYQHENESRNNDFETLPTANGVSLTASYMGKV
jgi:hypothetical protein